MFSAILLAFLLVPAALAQTSSTTCHASAPTPTSIKPASNCDSAIAKYCPDMADSSMDTGANKFACYKTNVTGQLCKVGGRNQGPFSQPPITQCQSALNLVTTGCTSAGGQCSIEPQAFVFVVDTVSQTDPDCGDPSHW